MLIHYESKLQSYRDEGFHDEGIPVADREVIPTPIVPDGTKSITENGVYDVREFANADVNVASGGGDANV